MSKQNSATCAKRLTIESTRDAEDGEDEATKRASQRYPKRFCALSYGMEGRNVGDEELDDEEKAQHDSIAVESVLDDARGPKQSVAAIEQDMSHSQGQDISRDIERGVDW